MSQGTTILAAPIQCSDTFERSFWGVGGWGSREGKQLSYRARATAENFFPEQSGSFPLPESQSLAAHESKWALSKVPPQTKRHEDSSHVGGIILLYVDKYVPSYVLVVGAKESKWVDIWVVSGQIGAWINKDCKEISNKIDRYWRWARAWENT